MQNGKGSGILIAIVVIGLLALLGQCSGGSSSEKSRTCQSCHRSFTNSADCRSIALSNMCENCYDNYKYSQELKEKMKRYKERYGN